MESPESLKPLSSKWRSIRSSQGAIQPPPDSRNAMRTRGCRSHRKQGDAEGTVGIGPAVVREPAVVGAAHRRGEPPILDRAGEEADARIEERGVNAVQVHVRDPRVRVEAALAAVDTLHGALVHRALPGADRPDDAEALRA